MPCLVVVAEADRSDLVYHGRVAPIAMIEIGALIRNRPVTGLSIYGLLQLSRIHRGRRKRLAAGRDPTTEMSIVPNDRTVAERRGPLELLRGNPFGNADDAQIASNLLGLAHNPGVDSVAEGIVRAR